MMIKADFSNFLPFWSGKDSLRLEEFKGIWNGEILFIFIGLTTLEFFRALAVSGLTERKGRHCM